MIQTTESAIKLLDSITLYAPGNAAEVMAWIAAMLDAEDGQVVGARHVAFGMRQLGKEPGEEVEVGRATQPLAGAYPGS